MGNVWKFFWCCLGSDKSVLTLTNFNYNLLVDLGSRHISGWLWDSSDYFQNTPFGVKTLIRLVSGPFRGTCVYLRYFHSIPVTSSWFQRSFQDSSVMCCKILLLSVVKFLLHFSKNISQKYSKVLFWIPIPKTSIYYIYNT